MYLFIFFMRNDLSPWETCSKHFIVDVYSGASLKVTDDDIVHFKRETAALGGTLGLFVLGK